MYIGVGTIVLILSYCRSSSCCCEAAPSEPCVVTSHFSSGVCDDAGRDGVRGRTHRPEPDRAPPGAPRRGHRGAVPVRALPAIPFTIIRSSSAQRSSTPWTSWSRHSRSPCSRRLLRFIVSCSAVTRRSASSAARITPWRSPASVRSASPVGLFRAARRELVEEGMLVVPLIAVSRHSWCSPACGSPCRLRAVARVRRLSTGVIQACRWGYDL